jgi:hypothetical protein
MIRRSGFVVAVSILGIAAQLIGAAPAGANRPTSYFENNVHFACDQPGVTTADGTVLVFAEDSTEFGRDASIAWWVPPDTIENTGGTPTFVSSPFITDQVVTRNGYHFDIDLKMIDPSDFSEVGNATASIDLIPTGLVENATPKKSRFGNRTTFDKSVVKFFNVSGSVTMHVVGHDPTVFDVTNCNGPDGSPADHAGFDTTIDVRTSDPSQFVLNNSGILVACTVGTNDYILEVDASSEEAGTSGQIIFTDANGTVGGATESTLTLTDEVFSGTVGMENFDTGEAVGDAVVDVRFTRGPKEVVRSTQGDIRDTLIGYLLEPTGTITIPTQPTPTVVDFSGCIFVFEGREQQKEHRPR